jgi:membrane protein YqaA with SNARE-associated domain
LEEKAGSAGLFVCAAGAFTLLPGNRPVALFSLAESVPPS